MGQSVVDPPDDHVSEVPNGRLHRSIPSNYSSGEPPTPLGFHYLKRLCRERGILFEDPDFNLNAAKIPTNKHRSQASITWMRPFEICARPRFISENTSRFDIEQGELGDYSLVAAVSCLTMTPRFLERVVPPDQSFHQAYCGIFRFRFWRFGDWVEIIVDDRLPTSKGRPLFLRSTDPTEFWPALLEKAYAKFYSGYSNLLVGRTAQVLQDLTGGVAQNFRMSEHDPHVMFQTVNSCISRSTLLAASIHTDQRSPVRLRNGLVTQHAYSVTGLARVRTRTGEVPLIRLRNPWGKGEWNGPWSDRSWEWDSLPERDQELLSVRIRNDGEFWMSFEDFLRNFTFLDLLHVGPDDWMLESALHSKRPWRAVLARRRWRVGFNAGGGPQYKDTTAMNPQFRVHIAKSGAKKCHVVVSILQFYSLGLQSMEQNKKHPLLPLGFTVYEVPPNISRINSHFVHTHQPLDVVQHPPVRESVIFFTLPPGDFVIMPFTAQPNCETKFLLRIFTDEMSNIWEVNDENMICRELTFTFNADMNTLQKDFPVLTKLMHKIPPEIDALTLQKILRSSWKSLNLLCEKPSLELCRNLIMLRDPLITGKISRNELPGLIYTLQYWRVAFAKHDSNNRSKSSSFNFRSLLWDAGVTVSNKVLECAVLRCTKNSILTSEAYLLALVKLYLAHERFVTVEKKMKENAMTLEEMILLTVYS
ncbi:calpain-9 isoform X2 [Parasteatoda tepidariorum]|uniref:calpain-9 isoform X1 n=1 Tax=Parasteatoda tepidariorum TaxID=114398 RepID=UPI00077FCB39|nr:calpain-9 [Parasteatoda tepidariorum]XP_042894442.1 calpain-9 [Parasteatoda tepidariorum]